MCLWMAKQTLWVPQNKNWTDLHPGCESQRWRAVPIFGYATSFSRHLGRSASPSKSVHCGLHNIEAIIVIHSFCLVLDAFQQWVSRCAKSTCTAWHSCPSSKRKSGSPACRPRRVQRGRKGCYSTLYSTRTFYLEGTSRITFVDHGLAYPCVPLCNLAYPCVPLRSLADHIICNHNSNFSDNNSHRVYVSVTRCCKFSLYDSARWVVARSQNNLWLAQEILDFGFYCHDKIFYLLGPGVSTHSYFLPTVAVGRFVMHLVVSGITVHELYTAAFGLYIIWLLCRTASIVFSWLPLGLNGVFDRMKSWTLLVSGFTFEPVWILYHTKPYHMSYQYQYHTIPYHDLHRIYLLILTLLKNISNMLFPFQILKCCVISIFVVGVIPFLLGLIFELVVVSPLRVGMDQSPLYFPAQVRLLNLQ